MADFQQSRSEVEAALESTERRLARAFLGAYAAVRSEIDESRLERLLREGRRQELSAIFRRAATRFAVAYQREFLDRARRVGRQLGEALGSSFVHDPSRSLARLREERDRLVEELTRRQVDTLFEAARLADRPRETRESGILLAAAGLSAAQVRAVANYRALLLAGAAAALDRALSPEPRAEFSPEEPLGSRDVERMTSAYRRNQLALAASSFGLLWAHAAVEGGAQDVFQQAAEDGEIDPAGALGRWRTRGDEKVRRSHSAMHGQVRPVGQAFVSGDGNLLRFPGDPRAPRSDTAGCRCVVLLGASAPAPILLG